MDEPGVNKLFEGEDKDLSLENTHRGDQLDGRLDSDMEEERLAHTVVDVDVEKIDDGMVVEEAFNQNLGSFMPDMMFKELVSNFKNAKKLYGETIIRELAGYDPDFIDKNRKIPEFQRDLQKRLKDRVEELHKKGVIRKNGTFTAEALNTAALFLIEEEFKEHYGHSYRPFGEQVHLANDRFGERSFVRPFRKGDPYKDVAMKHTISRAVRRGRTSIEESDLQSFEREARQQVNVVYALDISGSMKGEKLRLAKRAGVSLAHKAIRDHNKVGLVLFGTDIEEEVHLTSDLLSFVKPLTIISPGNETDIALAIEGANRLLADARGVRHIVILTDGLHTTSKDPEKVVLEQVAIATGNNTSISVVGINLDDTGKVLAQAIVDRSGGRLHGVQEAKDIGGVIIADYEKLL